VNKSKRSSIKNKSEHRSEKSQPTQLLGIKPIAQNTKNRRLLFSNLFFDNSNYDITSEIDHNRLLGGKMSNNSSLKKTEKSMSHERSLESSREVGQFFNSCNMSKFMPMHESHPRFQSPLNDKENRQPTKVSNKHAANLKLSTFSNELDNVTEKEEMENSPYNGPKNKKIRNMRDNKMKFHKVRVKNDRNPDDAFSNKFSNKYEESCNDQISINKDFFSPQVMLSKS
jgi:hypothetical protein